MDGGRRAAPEVAGTRGRYGVHRIGWHTRVVRSTIRTTCSECGTVDVPVGQAHLEFAVHGDSGRNTVHFTCPRCGLAREQRLGERGTRLLLGAGICVAARPAPRVATTGHREPDRP